MPEAPVLSQNCRERQIVQRPIASLVPQDRKLRLSNRRQRRALEASIQKVGFTNPVLIDAEGRIIAGHARVEAAKRLGMDGVPTICLEGLTPEQTRAYIIADNKIAEMSKWDRELLALEFKELAINYPEMDLGDTGFSVCEIDLVIEEYAASTKNAKAELIQSDLDGRPVARLGDVWHLGRHVIACADSRDPHSYVLLLGGKKAQMVFTDPPYNVRISGHVSGLGKIRHREFAMASGEMKDDDFIAFLDTICANLVQFSLDGSIHYLCIDWRHVFDLQAAGRKHYVELKNICVWNKTNGGMGTFYRSKHELVVVYKNGRAPHINNFGLGEGGRYRSNVWDYPGMSSLTRERLEDLELHPTVKPVALVADAMRDCSKRNGIILDPFLGSGTTVLAAEIAGRRAYGIELDPLYIDTVIRRWQRITGERATRRDGKSFDDLEDLVSTEAA